MFRKRTHHENAARPAETRALQLALIAFLALATVYLLVVYTIAPEIYVQTLMSNPTEADTHPVYITYFLVCILGLVTFLVFGVLRRWRWSFWLILVAFAFQPLSILATILELSGVLPLTYPVWYALTRMVVSVFQTFIAIWMIRLYRRSGVWAMGDKKSATVM